MPRLVQSVIDSYRTDGIALTLRKCLRHISTSAIPVILRRVRYGIHRLKYDNAAPRANRIIHISPEAVKLVIWPGFYSNLSPEYTYIRDGSWDTKIIQSETGHWDNLTCRSVIPFQHYTPYLSFVNHFKNNVPWEETKYFKMATSDPERNRLGTETSPRWEKFEEWDEVYESMKREGYNNQSGSSSSYFNQTGDEILIDIGRNGQLILDDGRHRLMIAKILGIEQVPVRVLVRHELWQKKRESLLTGNISTNMPEEFINHPDVKSSLD